MTQAGHKRNGAKMHEKQRSNNRHPLENRDE